MTQIEISQMYVERRFTSTVQDFLQTVNDIVHEKDNTKVQNGILIFHSLHYISDSNGKIVGCVITFKLKN